MPVVLRAERLGALVVGGGAVAARRAGALADAGARVRVVAPELCEDLQRLAARNDCVVLERRRYEPSDIGDAHVVVAATDDRDVNARVASDAHAARRLVNVADAPDEGNCIIAAAHRSGELLVGVTTGGVPGAAARVRDAIAARFDARYGDAVGALAALRRRLLDADRRDDWHEAAAALTGADFCETIERGELAPRIARWR